MKSTFRTAVERTLMIGLGAIIAVGSLVLLSKATTATVSTLAGGGQTTPVRATRPAKQLTWAQNASSDDDQEAAAPQKPQKIDVISLSEDNSVVMDAVFDDTSVQRVMLDIQALSNRLGKKQPIYLILNTPGGSVVAGEKLITFIKALPQEVKTITIFAASMGFVTAQHLGERLILNGGTLMSHPPSFGVEGNTPYQIVSRYNWIMSQVTSMENVCAGRMGLNLSDYRRLIHDEYWVYSGQAVEDKAADRLVLASCGKYASPTKSRAIDTMFGTFIVEVASCPLIPGFVSIKVPKDATNAATNYVKAMFTDRQAVAKEYITNGRYLEFQK